jgi:SPP1 family phage portal protein
VLDSRNCIPIYDTTLNNDLLYVIRFYKENNYDDLLDNYVVEVYTSSDCRIYQTNSTLSAFSLLEIKEHHFSQVPITVFNLNSENESIFDKIITLQDAYNKLISSEVDDFEAFCDAYLVLKGCMAEDEDVKSMK